MPKSINITGQTFGRLTVVELDGRDRYGYRLWHCRCICGGETTAIASRLKRGLKKSCGCLQREDRLTRIATQTRTHGQSRTRLWRIWSGMRQRCGDPNASNFARYGGRGVKVCEEWKHSFVAFRDWAMAHGYQDDLAIDRIDSDGNYEPSNCRWTTYKQQNRNRSLRRAVIRSDGKAFDCLIDAAQTTGAGSSNILEVCEGRRKTAGGFGWRYDERRSDD